jgi:hypothetical protein
MHKISAGNTADLLVNLTILAINVLMLYILLTANTILSSMSVWEIAVNRMLIFGNLTLVLLSFPWIYTKRIELQKMINEIKNK